MYTPAFEYYRANTVAEAHALMKAHRGAKWLAGGHSLLPLMKLRLSDPGVLIDIGRIAELKGIRASNGSLRIGALATHAIVAASEAAPQGLREAAAGIGDAQVRNRGTVGGNVSHADPASDLPTILTALGATFHASGPKGERVIAAKDFFTGLFESALAADELLTAVEVPATAARSGSAYAKMGHPASRYALVGAGAMVTLDGGVCKSASVAFGGLVPAAKRATHVEQALTGKKLDAKTIADAAALVKDDLGDDILGDFHASAEYRSAMAVVYVKRALALAAERAG
jgi:carbon-monoxide dehydrogenase medium subunit